MKNYGDGVIGKSKWWKETDPHSAVFSVVKHLDNIQNELYEKQLLFMRMYTNRNINGFGGRSYDDNNVLTDMLLSNNVAKNLVDAAMSKISTKKVKPMFLTSGGSAEERKRGKLLNKFASGQFAATNIYKHARQAFRDSCIFGKGFLKIYDDRRGIKVERVFPPEIIVDPEDAKYNEPSQLFQHKEVGRDVLASMFKGKDEIVEGAGLSRRKEENAGLNGVADCVSVIEAWHLPSSPDAKDGRHVIAVNTGTLIDEEWTRDTFPFVQFQWSEPVLGFWGCGIIEEVKEKQLEIDELERKIQEEMHLGGVKIFVRKGVKIAKDKISNILGAVYEVPDPHNDVVIHNANMVSQETFAQVDREERKMYELTGISQLTAQSQKPSGLNSGKALREYYDIESERFQHVVQLFEESMMEAAAMMVELAREISKRDGEMYKILAKDKTKALEINWSDVDLDADKYIMQKYPTSFLPSTPAGQWQQMQEMLQAGFIGREEGLELLDYPDTQKITRRLNAPYNIVEKDIERILEEGEAVTPEPYYNLQLAMRLARDSYNEALCDGYDEERMEMLRRYIDAIKVLAEPPMQPPMMQQPQEVGPEMPAQPIQGEPPIMV